MRVNAARFSLKFCTSSCLEHVSDRECEKQRVDCVALTRKHSWVLTQMGFLVRHSNQLLAARFKIRVRKATGWRHDFKREDRCVLTQGDSRLNYAQSVVRSTFQPEHRNTISRFTYV